MDYERCDGAFFKVANFRLIFPLKVMFLPLVSFLTLVSCQLFDQSALDTLSILPLPVQEPSKAFKSEPDKSLLENIAARPELSVFHSLIVGTWLANALEAPDADLTVFAPTNDAFKKWHAPPDNDTVVKHLLYHLASPRLSLEELYNGQLLVTSLELDTLKNQTQPIRVFKRSNQVYLNWHASIETPDIEAINGIVHTVSSVIPVPMNLVHLLAHFPARFGLLSYAIKRTGLGQALYDAKGVTVFAPTNRAFLSLGVRVLRYLFSNDGLQVLKAILLYHVAPELAYSQALLDAGTTHLSTLLPKHKLLIEKKKSEIGVEYLQVNGESKFTWYADGLASNGVVQAIDKVLIPEQKFHKLKDLSQ